MKTYSLKDKIIRSNCLIIAVLLTVLELVVYLVVSRIQIADAVKLNQMLAQTICVGVDNSVKAFRGQINFVTMSNKMQDGLRSIPKDEESAMFRKSALLSAIVRNTLVINEVDAVYLYGTDEKQITYWQKRPTTSDTRSLFEIMPKLEYAENGGVAMSLYEGQLVFSRRILDLNSREILGYCVFVYEMDKMETLLNNISPDSNRLVALLTPQGQVVACNESEDPDLVNTLNTMKPEDYEGTEAVWADMGKESVLVCSHHTDTDGWKLVCLVKKSQLLISVQVMALAIFVLGMAGIFLGILMETYVANRMVLPLIQLTEQVKRIGQADYSTHNSVNTKDEIELLGQSMNHMNDQINILINQVLKGEIQYKDMQLQALQAQINPHFLYNTLECINSLAQLGRKEEVRTVTVAFSDITKSLLAEAKEVAIENELKYVEDFLKIYQIMLGNKLKYTIEIQAGLEKIMIPRMTVQPFVENAVLHGIKPCGREGTISVSVVLADAGILISVNDDGKGIEQERLESIEQYIDGLGLSGSSERIGVGMKNVIRRIRLYYGEDAGIHVSSFPDMGTTIDLMLPAETGETFDSI